MKTSLARVGKVTGGLALGGAVAGGLCATAVAYGIVSGFGLVGAGLPDFGTFLAELGLAAFLGGAVLGAIVTPTYVWLVLRHVSFGSILRLGVPATIAGAIVGEWLFPLRLEDNAPIPGVICGAVIGFGCAGVLARVIERRRREQSAAEAG